MTNGDGVRCSYPNKEYLSLPEHKAAPHQWKFKPDYNGKKFQIRKEALLSNWFKIKF